MAKKLPITVVMPMQPDGPDGPEDFDQETFWAWLAKMAKKAGSKVVEKALLALYVLIDPKTPNGARVVLVAALAYLILPTDAIPDFLPVGGFVDDLAALVAAIAAIAENVRVRHLRDAREQMNEWGIVVDLVPASWDDNARLSDVDEGDSQAEAA